MKKPVKQSEKLFYEVIITSRASVGHGIKVIVYLYLPITNESLFITPFLLEIIMSVLRELKKRIPDLKERDFERVFTVLATGEVEHFTKAETVSEEEYKRFISKNITSNEWDWLTSTVFTGTLKVAINPKRAGLSSTSHTPKFKANELVTFLWDYTDELTESIYEANDEFYGKGKLEFDRVRFVKVEDRNGILIYEIDVEFYPSDFTENIPDWDPGF